MAKSGFAAGHLRSFIERIERLEEEKKSIGADIKEVFAEAKGAGFDTKIMRKVIALRKLDTAERQEMEAVLDLYKSALGMDGTPLGQYADREMPQRAPKHRDSFDALTDAVKAAGPRVADVKAKLDENETVDPETGEVTIVDQTEGSIHLSVSVDERVAKVVSNAPRPSKRDVSTNGKPYQEVGPQAETSHAGTGSGTPAVQEGRSTPESYSGANVSAGVTGGESATHSAIGSLSADPGDIPSFLRRTKSPIPA